jgi:hypothetical protein
MIHIKMQVAEYKAHVSRKKITSTDAARTRHAAAVKAASDLRRNKLDAYQASSVLAIVIGCTKDEAMEKIMKGVR